MTIIPDIESVNSYARYAADSLLERIRRDWESGFDVVSDIHGNIIVEGRCIVTMAQHMSNIKRSMQMVSFYEFREMADTLRHVTNRLEDSVSTDVYVYLINELINCTMLPDRSVKELNDPSLAMRYVPGDFVNVLGKEAYLMSPEEDYVGFRLLWGDGKTVAGVTHERLACLKIGVSVPNEDWRFALDKRLCMTITPRDMIDV